MSVDINATRIVFLLQCVALAAGVLICWKSQFSAGGVEHRRPKLGPWQISTIGILSLALQAVLGGIVGLVLASFLNARLPSGLSTDSTLSVMIVNSGFHFGVLAGIFFGRRQPESPPDQEGRPDPERFNAPVSIGAALKSGFLTYLAALPLVAAAMWVWQQGLDAAGIPRPKQELIDMFSHTHGFWRLTFMTLVAVVIAPMTEELVFRAGIFRFVRTRLPRVLSLVLPAVLFGAAHLNLSAFVPLLVLAIVLSLAYERTGRVITPIVAHGLFNLTTVAFLLSGLAAN
jgi:membrane protease YdiL (CAAX protease family)